MLGVIIAAVITAVAAYAGAYIAVASGLTTLYREQLYAKQFEAYTEIVSKADDLLHAVNAFVDSKLLINTSTAERDKSMKKASATYLDFERSRRRLTIFLHQEVIEYLAEFSKIMDKEIKTYVSYEESAHTGSAMLLHQYDLRLTSKTYVSVIDAIRRNIGTEPLNEATRRLIIDPRSESSNPSKQQEN